MKLYKLIIATSIVGVALITSFLVFMFVSYQGYAEAEVEPALLPVVAVQPLQLEDARVPASVETLQVDTGAKVTFTNTCTTTLTLTDPSDGVLDNGLSGYMIDLEMPTSGAVTIDGNITIPGDFSLQSVVPIITIRASGSDVGKTFEPGIASVELFKVTPCITQAEVYQLDDDNGGPIFDRGDILKP